MSLPDATVNKNLEGSGARATVQRFGAFLAGMIMPNIGAFIAWGLLAALFIETGWWPNESLGQMVDPILKYLLPLLIGYTGGRAVHGQRGAVIGAIATMGVVVGAEIPMFLGAMIMGPVSAWLLKRFDKAIEGRVATGFEMLVDNFSLGILGLLLAIVGKLAIGPTVDVLMGWMAAGVNALISARLLPLASIFVEPAKVLFLNNAVNHGILTPLGAEQAQSAGRSILFMVESNPGPGFGLLMAYWLAGPRSIRGSVPGAVIIHLFGGIHEIFFPYVLMKPKTIAATIAGGMSGLFVGSLLNAGLVAPASPGSILAWFIVTPRDGYLPMLATFLTAAVVSFVVAWALLRLDRDKDDEGAAEALGASGIPSLATGSAAPAPEADLAGTRTVGAAGTTGVGTPGATGGIAARDVDRLIVACDAGMGSSVMVASTMRKQLKPYGVDVTHARLEEIPSDAKLVLTQSNLVQRARHRAPGAVIVPFTSYVGDPAFAQLAESFAHGGVIGSTGGFPERATGTTPSTGATATTGGTTATGAAAGTTTRRARRPRRLPAQVLTREAIRLGLAPVGKDEAIRTAGDLLAGLGATANGYTEAMFDREQQVSTFMGNGVAIPHGTNEARGLIRRAALGVLQYPDGIDWDGHTVNVVIPIASPGDEHVGILAALATIVSDPDKAERLRTSTDPDEVLELLAPEEGE